MNDLLLIEYIKTEKEIAFDDGALHVLCFICDTGVGLIY